MRLPEGVYPLGDKFNALAYRKGQPLKNLGLFDCPFKAEYAIQLDLHGHHWADCPEDISEYFGFVYIIVHKRTGKAYVGKKVFRFFTGPRGSFSSDDCRNKRYVEDWWKESDWKAYTGSSKDLNKEIREQGVHMFHFEILDVCYDGLELHLSEVAHQVERNVLWATDKDGDYTYYNRTIAGEAFRPIYSLRELEEAKRIDAERVAEYYLHPRVCQNCQSIIPYLGECSC